MEQLREKTHPTCDFFREAMCHQADESSRLWSDPKPKKSYKAPGRTKPSMGSTMPRICTGCGREVLEDLRAKTHLVRALKRLLKTTVQQTRLRL